MGSIKSKVFGDTALDEDNTASSSHSKESVSSLQRSISNSSYSEEFLVVKQKSELDSTPASESVNQGKKSVFDRSADEIKKQSKTRPHSLYDDSTANFRTYDLNICETSANEKKEPDMTTFQPSNNIQKSQYFRSFRYASKRFFNKKNLNQNNVNEEKTSNIEQPDSFDSSKILTSSFEKVFKSKSQTELNKKINSKNSGTFSSSNIIDSEVRMRNSVHAAASRVKNLRNSVTNFNFTEQAKKQTNEPSAINKSIASPKKIKDLKLKGRAKNIDTQDKLPVPSLGLDKSSSSSKMEQESKNKKPDDDGQQESQEQINEKVIEHLKDQIDILNDQLLNVGKEDSKIINDLIEKIEQISKMNSKTISSPQRNSQSSSSIFGKLFGKVKSSPQPSPNSSQTSFTSDYYTKLQAQNDAIDQVKQFLYNSASFTAQPTMSQSYVYYPSTSTAEHSHEQKHGHDHATEEDEEPAQNNAHTHNAYYNQNYTNNYANNPYASTGYYNNQSSPNTTSAYQTYPNQWYQMNGQLYYPNNTKGYHQPQQQQQLIYNPQTGKYYYQNNNAQTNPKSAYYAYPQANTAGFMNQQFFPYKQQNSNDEKSNSDDVNEESKPGVIITEVDDEENEYDLSKMRAKKKDYVDAISLKDE